MNTHDATEQAWKNGYLTAIEDIKEMISGDKQVFNDLVDKLLTLRGIEKYNN